MSFEKFSMSFRKYSTSFEKYSMSFESYSLFLLSHRLRRRPIDEEKLVGGTGEGSVEPVTVLG